MIPTSPVVTTVVHPVIVTADMERSLTFYRDRLGLAVSYDQVHDPAIIGELTGYENPNVRAVILKAPDDTEVEIAEFHSPMTRPNPASEWRDSGIRSITFLVGNLDELVQELTSKGVQFLSHIVAQPLGGGGSVYVVYCRDPDGVIVTLAQMPEGQRSLAE